MRFFKHHSDAHRSKTLSMIYDDLGHLGISCYWTLQELCVDQLEKDQKTHLKEEDCQFDFPIAALCKVLRIKRKNFELILSSFSVHSDFQFIRSENKVRIVWPKLLKFLTRDMKRARFGRGESRGIESKKLKNSSSKQQSQISKPDFEQVRTPSVNASRNFENSFSPHVDSVHDILKQIFTSSPPRFIVQRIPRIIAFFETAEHFAEWAQLVINAPNCPEVTENREGFLRYFSAALEGELRKQP